jgi:hypothetical protein
MDKRIEKVEEKFAKDDNFDDDIERIRKGLYPRFINGEDISEELEAVFDRHPKWLHNPPGAIGRLAYIDWAIFSGHAHASNGECGCGFEPPED